MKDINDEKNIDNNEVDFEKDIISEDKFEGKRRRNKKEKVKKEKVKKEKSKNKEFDEEKIYNKNKGIVVFIVLILLLVFIYYELFSIVSYTLGKREKDDVLVYKIINIVNQKFFPEKIKINEDYNLNVLSLGDIYMGDKVLNIYKKNNYNLDDSYKYTKEYFKNFDVITASLNTKIGNGRGFNPVQLLDLIKSLNISVLSTANNNIYDKTNNTLKCINEASLNQVGLNNVDPYIIEKNNIKVGIVSYLSIDDDNKRYDNINLLTDENIDKDIKFLKDNNVDCVIAYVNSANENSSRISLKQKEDMNKLIDKGIDIVLGTGSKVINEVNEDRYEDEGNERHTVVVYAMGDFIGEFLKEENRYSLGVNVEISKKLLKDGTGKVLESETKVNVKKPIELYNKVNKDFSFINYPINYISKSYSENKIEMNEELYTELTNVEDKINDILNK